MAVGRCDRAGGHGGALPAAQRFDRYYMERRERYAPVDHAAYSNEGVRARDVVECLLAGFDFERFLAFGGAIMPFVERRIGFNFDPSSAEDAASSTAWRRSTTSGSRPGTYPASNMIAVLRHKEGDRAGVRPDQPGTAGRGDAAPARVVLTRPANACA